MPSSVVRELQQLASDGTSDVGDVLRKAMIVASKLSLADAEGWLKSEMKGYQPGEEVPEYRKVVATLKVVNPYHGLQPLYLDAELDELLTHFKLPDSVTSLSSLVRRSEASNKHLMFPIPPKFKVRMLQELDLPVEPVRVVDSTNLEAIIEAVRTRILEWSLELEREGILGENMTFTEAEKELATASTTIHIANVGNLQHVSGNVSNSEVTQQSTVSVSLRDIESLRAYLESIGIPSRDVDDLETALSAESTLTGKEFGPKVSAWIGKIVSKIAGGSVKMAMSSASSLIAKALWKYYGE